MNRNLIIVRGVSGCGKTTFAELMAKREVRGADWPVLSADNYFIDEEGNYNWDGKLLFKAHNWCIESVKQYMITGTEKIFVANTSPAERDLRPYYDLAEQFGQVA